MKGLVVVAAEVGVPAATLYIVSLTLGAAALGLANSTLYSTQIDPGVALAVQVTIVAKATASSL